MRITTIEELYEVFLLYPSICTDTRKIKKDDIFFALKGDNFNGNSYALQALEHGAAYAVVDENVSAENDRIILVDNVLETLQSLATHHRLQSNATILAITGTNGKTTTKELIAQVLQSKYRIIFTEGNLNNHIGVPLTLLRIKKDTEIAIIEMGANHIGEIESYCKWAQPDCGLITNIGKAHLEGFGGLEGVKVAKGELYKFLNNHKKHIFRYTDDINLKEIGENLFPTTTYGTKDADIIGQTQYNSKYAELVVTHPKDLSQKYTSQLVGAYNTANMLCAITVGHHFKVDSHSIAHEIASYTPKNARSQFIQIGNNNIILDAYNANPTSMSAAIENFYLLPDNNKVLCLGGMKELGEDSIAEHKFLIELLIEKRFTKVYLVGKEFSDINHPYNYFEDSSELKNYIIEHPITRSTILIKGSRGSKMEVLLEAFNQ